MEKATIKITKRLDKSLVERLVFLKYTLEEALNYLRDTTNEYGFTVGISLLHDSIENLFWAIALKRKVSIKDISVPEKFEQLSKSIGKKIAFDKTSLVGLCRVRDSYKHHALLPNISQTVSITDKIVFDFYQTINNIFGIDLEVVSLSSLILDEKLKKEIQDIEKLLYGNKKHTYNSYKDLLFKIGETYFNHFEINFTLFSLQDAYDIFSKKKRARFKFPKRDVNEIALNHLELGLTPYLYWRFKNFVPEFGVDTETNETISKMSFYWGRENWTYKNVKFCLNWLINYALKRQWLYSNKQYDLNSTHRVQVVVPRKEVKITLSNYDTEKNLRTISEFSLQAGLEYLGCFIDFVDGAWQDYEENVNTAHFILYTSGLNYHGEIDKNTFDIVETYFDDIPNDKMNVYLSNASQAGKVISKETVKRTID